MSSSAGSAPRASSSLPRLSSLAPRYSEEQHGAYFAILKRAIEEQPEARNIALAGNYGTGKSSILRKVREEFEHRVIEVSLLTLGVEPESVESSKDSNPAANTTTNRIQKEIVKQLLYQQSPSDAPESRFRRITRFRWDREVLIAVVCGLIALAIARGRTGFLGATWGRPLDAGSACMASRGRVLPRHHRRFGAGRSDSPSTPPRTDWDREGLSGTSHDHPPASLLKLLRRVPRRDHLLRLS